MAKTLLSRGSSAQTLEARVFMTLPVEPSNPPCPATLQRTLPRGQNRPRPTACKEKNIYLQNFQATGDLRVDQMTQGGERCRETGRARTEPETQRLRHWQAGRESTKELEREPTRRGGSPMKEGSPWKPRGKWSPNSNVAEKSQKLKTEGCLLIGFNSKSLTQLVGLQPPSLHSRRGMGRGWEGTRNVVKKRESQSSD